RAPEFMQLTVDPRQPVVPGEELDFRDEVMAQIYDAGDPAPKRKLVFRIETSDTGVTKGSQLIKEYREITGWRHVGSITFNEAVASFNGDHVLHFNHPRWRGLSHRAALGLLLACRSFSNDRGELRAHVTYVVSLAETQRQRRFVAGR